MPPVDGLGSYTLAPGAAYGPVVPVWEYVAPNPTDFFADVISGAHRLPNGNTLIDNGPTGTLFEVTPAGETVWLYVNPATASGPLMQGTVLPIGGNDVFRAFRYPPDFLGPGRPGPNTARPA